VYPIVSVLGVKCKNRMRKCRRAGQRPKRWKSRPVKRPDKSALDTHAQILVEMEILAWGAGASRKWRWTDAQLSDFSIIICTPWVTNQMSCKCMETCWPPKYRPLLLSLILSRPYNPPRPQLFANLAGESYRCL